MIPVVTAEQMRAADAAALADVDDPWTFIRRAGHATAEVARTMMGGAYARRVVVIAGKGNNGNDGRVAAALLGEWGASVRVIDAAESHDVFIDHRTADLVIDAAYGIGFRGTWSPPIVFDVPVLAVDIPSGLDATTGFVNGGILVADRTERRLERLRDEIGPDIGLTSGAAALKAALDKFKVKKVSALTPYQPVGDEQVHRFLVESGYQVHKVVGLECDTATSIAHTPRKEVIDCVLKELDHDSVDAIVQAGRATLPELDF